MDQSEPVELRRTAASIDCFDARDISGKTQRRVHPGFISSQAFVDRFEDGGGVKALLPTKSAQGLTFKPTHPKAVEALSWMGFEARSAPRSFGRGDCRQTRSSWRCPLRPQRTRNCLQVRKTWKTFAALQAIADDIETTSSNLFFSLAFLFQTPGAILNAITKLKQNNKIFCYGISDHQVKGLDGRVRTKGIDIQKPDGSVNVLPPEALVKNVPQPFKSEPTGGGTRMHHKFVVIDFNKPTGIHGFLQFFSCG
jgi:hypothetical protein